MRIAPSREVFNFHPNPQQIQPLKDLYEIFGGGLFYCRKPFGADKLFYNSEDHLISGVSTPFGDFDHERAHTVLRVHEPEKHRQAARWTIIEAYRTKYHEHHEKGSLLKRMPLALVSTEQLPAPEYGEFDESGMRVFRALGPLPPASAKELVVFESLGNSLPSAAHAIAGRFGELSSSSELDSSIAVAYALGATSMDHLEHAWGEAMGQPDPYKAAAAASKILLDT